MSGIEAFVNLVLIVGAVVLLAVFIITYKRLKNSSKKPTTLRVVVISLVITFLSICIIGNLIVYLL